MTYRTEDRPIPLGMEQELDQVADQLFAAIEPLPAKDAGLCLVAAGLDLLPGGRCEGHYREALLEVRGEVDRLLAEVSQ